MTDHEATPSSAPAGAWRDARWVLIEGATVIDFLQGYLTCNTTRLNDASLTPFALCNIKGRVVTSGWAVAPEAGQVRLLVHTSLADRVVDFLTPFARFARVTLTVQPGFPELTSEGLPLGDKHLTLHPADEQTVDLSAEMARALVDQRFAFLSAEVSERFLPQVLELPERGAVDFDKGCYLGQEVVARVQFRGQAKKSLQTFRWQGSVPVVGDKRETGDTVICFATSPKDPASGTGLAVA